VTDVERKAWRRPGEARGPIIATRRGRVIIVLRLRGPDRTRCVLRSEEHARARFACMGEPEAWVVLGEAAE
jgi:hypothetical protein